MVNLQSRIPNLIIPSRLPIFFVLIFFIFAFLIRVTDLTDPPMDFNPVRQLRSVIIARGIYFGGLSDVEPQKQKTAVNFWQSLPKYEPPILEGIVALGYRLIGGEHMGVPRVLNTVFWLIGGAMLFLLGSRMASPWGVVPGLAYYLFLPFSIYVSRSFQPEAWMVMWIVLTVYAFHQWADQPNWKWAMLVGVFGGMAALVKIVAAFFIGPLALAAILWRPGKNPAQNFKAALRNPQVWIMATLMVVPSAIYYLIAISESTAEYADAWTLLGDWSSTISPSFYIRWMLLIEANFGLLLVFLSLVGALIAKPFERALLLALWLGYFLHGVNFPRQIPTHDYYHIMLIPLVTLSLAPLAELLAEQLRKKPKWTQIGAALVLLLVSFYGIWIARSVLLGQNYTDTPAYWQEVSEALPPGRAVGYTQDFSLPMMYYGWRRIFILPQKLTAEKFAAEPEDADYFIITAMNQVDDELADYLKDHYPVLTEGDGYVIYDLKP
jgi:hypothetical protein